MNSDHVAKLPTELVLHVCRYLPLRSIACLTLTKISLYNAQDVQKIWRTQLSPSQQRYLCPEDFALHEFGSALRKRQMLHLRKDILNHELMFFFFFFEIAWV